MRFVSLSAQRVRFVSLSAQRVRFGGFARLAARFVVHVRRVSACRFTRLSSVFHFGVQCVPFGCMTRFFSVHSALGSGSQMVSNAFRFGEQWVRFREGSIVLPSCNLIGRLG